MSEAENEEDLRPQCPAQLVLPRIRVQNANAISSPMTWGFPAMTAFLGLMTALERRLGRSSGIAFRKVGVVCHGFEAQATSEGFTRAFHLTRNPVNKDGDTAAIVEEGRVHLELTLVFDVLLSNAHIGSAQRELLAGTVANTLAGMRLAGGSVMPALPQARRWRAKPSLNLAVEGDENERNQQFRKLMRQCMPGFALVSRDDLLRNRLTELQAANPHATALDAWLDLSRWNHHARTNTDADGKTSCTWERDERPGWTVPIPVGYAALSELYAPGTVANARDPRTPFRFVETLWSMGQWISPHRLQTMQDLMWYAHTEGETQHSYRCCNDYTPETLAD